MLSNVFNIAANGLASPPPFYQLLFCWLIVLRLQGRETSVQFSNSQKIGESIFHSISISRPATVAAHPAISVGESRAARKPPHSLRTFGLMSALLTVLGIGGIWNGNKTYAPEMYSDGGMTAPVAAFAKGLNYAVFDLNLNIRRLRDEQIAAFTETPDLILLGASHWQEANSGLVKHLKMYNAHIHRDYWEDPLGIVEILVKHNRLPKKMIIAIRDNQFTPVEARTDYLWEPGIPYYRAMADRLGLEKSSVLKTLPYERTKQMLSIAMLAENFTRWQKADQRPHATAGQKFRALDTLLPDGSIAWSDEHMNKFTKERTESESLKSANLNANRPPKIDPKGVEAFDALLAFLQKEGVTVYLARPPFNPTYYDHLQGTPYMKGLKRVEELTAGFAAKYGLKMIGSYNPHDLGCTSDMYIDAEHAHPSCLKAVFDQFTAFDTAKGSTS
jgi:hypothetical protein